MILNRNNRLTEILGKAEKPFFLICRFLLALVFIFSGFVKAIDPLGSTYKIEDYLNAFGGFFAGFTFVALPASIILSTLELLIGLNFLFHVQLRRTSFVALLFMLVMTPLTLYIAMYNPVTDCGCFGDALVITNWQTFGKNAVFLVLSLYVFVLSKKSHPIFLPRVEWILVLVFTLAGIGLSVYTYNHLPLIDFRPYKVGVNIPEAMSIPEGVPTDKYETTFIYEKDGVQQEFTLENYPKGDSTWTFVDQKTVLISKGYEAPIHNFSIVDAAYDDITHDLIEYEGSVYLLIMYDVNKASETGAKRAEETYQKYKNSDTRFYALTASSDDEVEAFKQKTGVTYPFAKTDPITLKTIVRANPGLMLMKNGTIIGKWHWRDF
jgi:uncharacterized membrane protein YphA (DoxX/SURF4 family)